MSQLILTGHKSTWNGSQASSQFRLNVTQFRSPMSAQINSVQTKKMLQHFPIRAGQPDINFTVKFSSQDEKHAFSAFVRDHQLNVQSHGYDGRVNLWWPERNIEDWTGFIVEYKVMERGVRDPAPSVTFGVSLVDSLMSEVTKISSFGASFLRVLGVQIPDYRGDWSKDDILVPPVRPSSDSSGTNSPSPYYGGFR